MSQRGQITMFMVVAMLLLAGAGLMYYLISGSTSDVKRIFT